MADRWKLAGGEDYEEFVDFYDVGGHKLGTYRWEDGQFQFETTNVYFAGKLIRSGDKPVALDRLGSVRLHGNERLDYFPYGEEKPGTTTQDRYKFGTYYRDSATGLDYADQRYYGSSAGRFITPDPFVSTTALANPSSGWNRYAYVEGDPVNFGDRSGEARESADGLLPIIGLLLPGLFGGGIPGGLPTWAGYFSHFVAVEDWKKNPEKKVREWDLAIAAAMAASQEEEEKPNRRYPHHLLLKEDCYTHGGYGGSVMRRRTYELQDQNNQMMAGGVRVTETNYVVQGNLGAYNSSWTGAIVIDYISKRSGPVTTQYQQFTAQVISGIDIMAAPVPVMVRDPARGDFGTLGINMEKDVIFINGDDGKVSEQYRWCP